ncbi:hypothetical protein JTB14_036896 [Gonioctena quinquepunctata]|nr:hypothetical protein JTB14_036896 [Gonioctena quinquepunctata]
MVDSISESKRSNAHKERFLVTCGILNEITYDLPHVLIGTSKFSIPYNIDLADIGYDIPAEIDTLTETDSPICSNKVLPILQNHVEKLPLADPSDVESGVDNLPTLMIEEPEVNDGTETTQRKERNGAMKEANKKATNTHNKISFTPKYI